MPPHSIQVERLNTSFGQESAVTAKIVALPEESREPESEIVQFFAGTCWVVAKVMINELESFWI